MKRKIFALSILLFFLPAWAQAVSFAIVDYSMTVSIGADGVADFAEDIAYDFEGEYNGLLMAIKLEVDAPLSDLRILVDGDVALTQVDALVGQTNTFVAEEKNGELSIRAYTPGNGDSRTYHITYRKEGFAKRYQDKGYIDRILFSAVNEYQKASFTVTLPGHETEKIHAVAQGGVGNDSFSISNGVISFPSCSVQAGQSLSVAISFPAEWLSEAQIIPSSLLEMQEAQDALDRKAQQDVEAGEQILRYTLLGGLLVYLIGFSMALRKQKKAYGWQKRVVSTVDEPLLSSIPAAIAELFYAKSVSSNALCATLMELAGQGFLTMRSEDGDTCFSIAPSSGDSPHWPHQSKLVEWLFENRQTLRIEDLNAGEDEAAANAFVTRYAQWKASVTQDAAEAGWLYRNGLKRVLLATASLVLGLFLALMLIGMRDGLISALTALVAVAFSYRFATLRRLSDEGEKRLAVLKGFLLNYQDLLTQDPSAVLGRVPLAFALGYIKPVAEWIDRHGNPPETAFAGNAPVWIFSGWHQTILGMERSAREAQSYNAGVAHDGSGSGGGAFTGGGGGSSHGAW